VEWGAFLLISSFLVGPTLQQRITNIDVVVQGREMKRGLELVRERVDISASSFQLVNGLKIAMESGMMDSGPPI
jgi:hypothetical protein